MNTFIIKEDNKNDILKDQIYNNIHNFVSDVCRNVINSVYSEFGDVTDINSLVHKEETNNNDKREACYIYFEKKNNNIFINTKKNEFVS